MDVLSPYKLRSSGTVMIMFPKAEKAAKSKLGDGTIWHTFTRYIPECFVSDYSKLEKGLKEFFPGGIDVTFEKETADHVAHYKVIGLRDSPDNISLQKFPTDDEDVLRD
ncbi:MFS transporter prlL [Fusarium oxysporum f. sp. albedinis]|nr:MFS transporter prlL [Fusarium oxysporum f. sp. albedinis]